MVGRVFIRHSRGVGGIPNAPSRLHSEGAGDLIALAAWRDDREVAVRAFDLAGVAETAAINHRIRHFGRVRLVERLAVLGVAEK